MKYFTLLFLFSGILFSCSNAAEKTPAKPVKTDELAKAAWLIGSWQFSFPEGTVKEMWTMKNDSVFMGRSFFIKGADTLSSESITLEQRGNDLYYIPTVKDQNAGQPVPFKMTSATGNMLVFENPAHDFPQKITYTQISKDSILAEISGKVDGQPQSEQFPLGRVK